MESLRIENWIDRNEFDNNPSSYYYFLHPEVDRQLIESILNVDSNRIELSKQMNNAQHKLFEQEISQLQPNHIKLLAEICQNPGLPIKKLGNNIFSSYHQKNYYYKKLKEAKLTVRKRDFDTNSAQYLHYPASGLTIEILNQFSPFPISTETKPSNIVEETAINHANTLQSSNYYSDMKQDLESSQGQDTQLSPEITDLFSKLNYIEKQREEIEQLEKKIQEQKNNLKKLEQEIIDIGGEEARKFILKRRENLDQS